MHFHCSWNCPVSPKSSFSNSTVITVTVWSLWHLRPMMPQEWALRSSAPLSHKMKKLSFEKWPRAIRVAQLSSCVWECSCLTLVGLRVFTDIKCVLCLHFLWLCVFHVNRIIISLGLFLKYRISFIYVTIIAYRDFKVSLWIKSQMFVPFLPPITHFPIAIVHF